MSKKVDPKKIRFCPGYSVTEIIQVPSGSWRAVRPVVNKNKCTKCKMCFWICPDSSITMTDSGPEINYEYCKGCGICSKECPLGAIEMVREEES